MEKPSTNSILLECFRGYLGNQGYASAPEILSVIIIPQWFWGWCSLGVFINFLILQVWSACLLLIFNILQWEGFFFFFSFIFYSHTTGLSHSLPLIITISCLLLSAKIKKVRKTRYEKKKKSDKRFFQIQAFIFPICNLIWILKELRTFRFYKQLKRVHESDKHVDFYSQHFL